MSSYGTVVIVDDECSIRHFIGQALGAAGYLVLEAGNAVEAKDAILAHDGEVALVISDIQMPGGNGLDLGVDLEGVRPKVPVLYISGLIDSIAVQSILLRNPFAILTKPFTDRQLVERVRGLIGSRLPSPNGAPPAEGSGLAPLKKPPARQLGRYALPKTFTN